MVIIFLDYFTNVVELFRGKTDIFTESDWIQPEFANIFTFLYMYMNRLVTIETVEEKTVFALKSFNRGHGEYTGKFDFNFNEF